MVDQSHKTKDWECYSLYSVFKFRELCFFWGYGFSMYLTLLPVLYATCRYTVKKSFSIFPSPAGIRLSLGGNNVVIYKLFPPKESLESDILAGDGNIEKLFLRCTVRFTVK